MVSREEGTEYEPSPGEPEQVLLSVKCKAETVVRVEVGKAVVAEAASSAGVLVGVAVVSLQFIVPAGEKWSVETASGIESVKSSYLPL